MNVRWTLVAILLVLPLAMAQGPDAGLENATDGNLTAPSGLDRFLDGVGDFVSGTADRAQDLRGSALGRLEDIGQAVVVSTELLGAQIAGAWTVVSGVASATQTTVTAVGRTVSTVVLGLTIALRETGQFVGIVVSTIFTVWGQVIQAIRIPGLSDGAYAAIVATGATGSAAASGLSVWALLRKYGYIGGAIPALGGFSRIATDELLDHPTRRQIYDLVEANPGIHASELSRLTGSGWGTISHHMDKLRKGQMVLLRKVGDRNCYFVSEGSLHFDELAVAGAVRNPTAGRIAAFVHDHPMSSQKEVSENLELSAALTSFHTKKLVNLGAIDKVRRGRSNLLTASQSLLRILQRDRSLLEMLRLSA